MPYEMKVDGMAEISEVLEKLEENAPKVASGALYEGAGVMADEIKSAVQKIQTEPFWYAQNGSTRLPSPEEKEILKNAAAGIAKFRKNGTEVDTSVGFQNSGYAQLKKKTVPVPVIANAINSGTSFMKKQPFFRKAANAGGKKAIQKMVNYIDDEWDRLYKALHG